MAMWKLRRKTSRKRRKPRLLRLELDRPAFNSASLITTPFTTILPAARSFLLPHNRWERVHSGNVYQSDDPDAPNDHIPLV
ncbi:hypothetical protein ARMSODRAFT_452473 [Armillaria solidipes]|uniref:Uncharacterized protein n=1 Tax=Armillaria solidipes TaxID=1076256 RepID=A0A2H3BP42_9AGAR|nr:hypothetical protein ARMSODRAFT_452473 [Armillaria solidipes]